MQSFERSLFFQDIYEKIPIAEKITFLVTALRSADNALEVGLSVELMAAA